MLLLTGLTVARRIAPSDQLVAWGSTNQGRRLDQQLDLKTGDIEQLAEAFNKMAVNLRVSFRTDRTAMEDVRRLEARYRDLIEHSPEMIYQLNKAGRFVHVNQTGLDKLGYTLNA
ncbi:MAG: PAS domain S-box protein [Nitrospira sp.]|nr:PAS domain S-box protein [Nitrospira sp.]